MSNVSWISAVGGDWDIASNWSSSPSIPGAAADVLIDLANGSNHDITHSSGAADTINSLTVTGNNLFSLSAGSITVSGAASLAAQVYLSGGALAFNGASSASQFSHSNGTLGGTGVLTVTGSALFLNQNVETGSGTTDLKGATTVGVAGWGNSYYTLGLDGGRVFKNEGALSWVGGIIQTGGYGGTAGNSTIDNAVGGVFDAQFDGQIRVLNGANVITNEGRFKKSAGGGAAIIAPALNNTGTVDVESGALVFGGPVTQYAVGSTTLIGGKWIAGPAASLQFTQDGLVGILTNNADVTLRGVGSDFGLVNSLTTNNGALRILGGRSFTTAGPFTNAGTLQLGGGVFDGASLTNAAAGAVLGFGALNQAVANAGTIEANGGALVLAGAISGSGALKIDAGAKLEVAGSIVSSETTLFNGAGSILQLDQANSFASTISGYGFGNLIDLHGVNATSATLAGSTLTVTKSDLSTFTLTLSGSYNGRAFAVQGDGAGGSWISVSGVTTTGTDALIGGAADDLVVATTKTLSVHDQIDGAGGMNTLRLSGGGAFDLRAPTTLVNIQVVQATEGAGAALPKINLRSGLNVMLNVASSATAGHGATIIGAADSSVINLGNGKDTVTLGSANETVHGGGGIDTFIVDGATIGATIDGGTGASILAVTPTLAGGVAIMGASITNIHSVVLKKAAVFTANATANLVITGSSAGDTITAGGVAQTLTGLAGADTLVGYVGGGDTFMDSSTGLNGDAISNFAAAGDAIVVTNIKFAGATVAYAGHTLTIANGATTTAITLNGGTFSAADFHLSAGAKGAARVIYTGPAPAAVHQFAEAMAGMVTASAGAAMASAAATQATQSLLASPSAALGG